ncbi:MAG TPA: sulfatase-like hydrolase/transferase, partial [Thermoanaerobaculia bacterium]|nr:sulfatase-like hydrolase/transferase [Thermoanaerobaculia bacterium]
DTLRSDRLPAYGYENGSTPAIDAFRRDAILFEHAFAQCPLTLPSHASLFTGELPYVHGVRNNLGYPLEPSHPSLASILKESGYQTGAAVSTFVLRKETGIAAGFDFYDDFMTHSPLESATSWQRDGDLSRQALTRWIESAGAGRKIFGFLHLYEPHSPYTPPAPYSNAADPYDGEISYSDAIVGRFLDDLKARGLYDSALIMILSDHGEGLGEHGEKEHGIFVYRESIQVPLLVKLPAQARAGESVARTVSLTDVFDTVLETTGSTRDRKGISLLAAPPAENRTVYSESYYPRLQYGWSELISVIGPEFHYIHAPRVELYRYRSDAAELTNVAAENRRDLVPFRQEIQRIADTHPFAEPRVADPEDVKKLAALGYLGSTSSASGPLPDPKDKLDVLRTFGEANDWFRTGQYARVIAVMEPLLKESPDFISGWGVLAQSYRKLGRLELALGTLRKQMNQSNGNAQVALAIAELLVEMKRYDEARDHAMLAKGTGGVFVNEMLAGIALAENDLAAAEHASQESLAAEPDRIQALMMLSQVRRLQQRPADELALLQRARDVVQRRSLPPIRDLELRRGETLLQARRVPEAEEAFRAETNAFPSNLQAWANLAIVVGAQGRRPEARTILDEAIRRNPGRASGELAVQALLAMNDEEGARELRARLGR